MVERVVIEAKEVWPTRTAAYRLELVIGIGSFGIVWKATCLEGAHAGETVAIKIIDMASYEEDSSMQDLRKEIAIMSTSRHPNIVTVYVSFISSSHLWEVMQIIDAGSFADIMGILD
jgi:serine/threonine protein kinase